MVNLLQTTNDPAVRRAAETFVACFQTAGSPYVWQESKVII